MYTVPVSEFGFGNDIRPQLTWLLKKPWPRNTGILPVYVVIYSYNYRYNGNMAILVHTYGHTNVGAWCSRFTQPAADSCETQSIT